MTLLTQIILGLGSRSTDLLDGGPWKRCPSGERPIRARNAIVKDLCDKYPVDRSKCFPCYNMRMLDFGVLDHYLRKQT